MPTSPPKPAPKREAPRGPKRQPKVKADKGDLIAVDEAEDQQEWLATWHHPRGTFSLLLSFQAPHAVAVTWKTDEGSYTARR
jgi:hypothetical protein